VTTEYPQRLTKDYVSGPGKAHLRFIDPSLGWRSGRQFFSFQTRRALKALFATAVKPLSFMPQYFPNKILTEEHFAPRLVRGVITTLIALLKVVGPLVPWFLLCFYKNALKSLSPLVLGGQEAIGHKNFPSSFNFDPAFKVDLPSVGGVRRGASILLSGEVLGLKLPYDV
jgi:hypothetical protein